MYQDYFNLTASPFENAPEPRFFFASEQHREALAAIEYTIRLRKGFVLITGDIGSGKTTVGQTMCERCGEHVDIVTLLHGQDHPLHLLQQVHRALHTGASTEIDRNILLEKLHEHLRRQHDQQRPVVLLVDEAQTCSDAALEELRLLSNFENQGEKLLQIVLIGQPELRDRLAAPTMAALRQRIVLAKRVVPLSLIDAGAYIQHRLRVAAVDPHNAGVTFDPAAIERIHRKTGGIPRLINTICDNCLLVAFVQNTRTITPAIVAKVVREMMPDFDQLPTPVVRANLPLSMVGSK